jgi:hypothetical protein
MLMFAKQFVNLFKRKVNIKFSKTLYIDIKNSLNVTISCTETLQTASISQTPSSRPLNTSINPNTNGTGAILKIVTYGFCA